MEGDDSVLGEVCENLGLALVGLKGKRIGLVANQTSVVEGMAHLVDVLLGIDGVEVAALFAPEHGFYGEMDSQIDSGIDSRTGLPIHSLYGKSRKPDPEMLEGIDVLVFSIQDVGVRFYTYISTMYHCMQAAADKGIALVVVDRPNPITGTRLEGNMSTEAFSSFVAVRPLPIRHGMTIGELAMMFNAVDEIGVELRVVKLGAWGRHLWFDETDVPWVMPSPAMPGLDTAIVYPGTCLYEGMNISLGRGTSRPFELVGAPWIDAFALSDAVNALCLLGTFFRPAYFVPMGSTHKGERCCGVQIHVMDREVFEPVKVAIHLLEEIRRLYPEEFEWGDPDRIDRKFGTDAVRKELDGGKSAEEFLEEWGDERRSFETVRSEFLVYE